MREHHHCLAYCYTRCTGDTRKTGVGAALTGGAHTLNGAAGFGRSDHPCKLRRQRDQKGFFTVVKRPFVPVLYYQHAQHISVVDNRHAKEGAELFLAGFRQVVIVGMSASVFQINRLSVARHQANKTLIQLQAYVANRLFAKTLGGHQDMAIDVAVQQVNRADLRVHSIPYARHNNVERSLQVPGGVHLLDYFTQSIEHKMVRLAGDSFTNSRIG